ncbi:unnamed protein product [Polarella glacialis]|uniref:Uncharacterized protein n=1 Tax=Polarella glacialis TaxID=89957 RepID=A0A813H7B7_POLGL|nr:unnamed protein product [Polarella glacialis]
MGGREMSTEAFMEELCENVGGYGRFFRTLIMYYFGWWVAVVIVPGVFLDHHRCEVRLPYLAWLLYCATVLAMLAMALLLELAVVQRLGLLQAGELLSIWQEKRWRLPLIATVIWKLDSYTDVAFIFIARDCGSSLWWASLATVIFGVVFCQLIFNTCFACTDCDRELPKSFGFMLLDFKLVNAAVRHVLPFDPDVSDLPVAKPVTLRTSGHLVGLEKVVGDIAQVSIQSLFLMNAKMPHGFIIFSVLMGVLNGGLSLFLVFQDCANEQWAGQDLQQGTALAPLPALRLPSGSGVSDRQPKQNSGGAAPSSAESQRSAKQPAPAKIGASMEKLTLGRVQEAAGADLVDLL